MPPQTRSPSGKGRARLNPPGIDAATVRRLAARARRTPEPNGHADPAPASLAPAGVADTAPSGAPPEAPHAADAPDDIAAGRRRRLHRLTLPIALAVATIGLGCLAAWFAASADNLTSQAAARNGALTDAAATSQVSAQVTSAIDALFSYNYAAPGPTAAAARRLLTGPAVRQYASLFGQVQREAPGKKLIVTTAVTHVGVEMLADSSARVLVFATETDRSASGGQPASAGAMLAVNAVLQDSTWKIEGIDTFSG